MTIEQVTLSAAKAYLQSIYHFPETYPTPDATVMEQYQYLKELEVRVPETRKSLITVIQDCFRHWCGLEVFDTSQLDGDLAMSFNNIGYCDYPSAPGTSVNRIAVLRPHDHIGDPAIRISTNIQFSPTLNRAQKTSIASILIRLFKEINKAFSEEYDCSFSIDHNYFRIEGVDVYCAPVPEYTRRLRENVIPMERLMTIISSVQASLTHELIVAGETYVKVVAQMNTLGASLKNCMSKETEEILALMQQAKKNE